MTTPSKTNPPAKTVQGLAGGTLRTTMTHVEIGDRVLVMTGAGDLADQWFPAPAKAPKRAVWGTVTSEANNIVVDLGMNITVILAYAPQTAITIKDRESGQAAPAEKSTARESRYVADHDTRMLLATRAMSIGYTSEGAATLMEEAYWVPAYPAPCGDECETHQGIRRYSDTGECRACEVERQFFAAAARQVDVEDYATCECGTLKCHGDGPCTAPGTVVNSAAGGRLVGYMCQGCQGRLDVAIPPTAPVTLAQRQAVRLLGELARSGATPQIHGATKRTLVRDGWITVGAATGVITLTGDALAWLASEHTAEVVTIVHGGVTLYGATCNCGTGHENPRLARRVPWSSAMLTTPEDAIAVALGHGEVSRPRYEESTLGETLAAQEAALDLPTAVCVHCHQDVTHVHGLWIAGGADRCAENLGGAHEVHLHRCEWNGQPDPRVIVVPDCGMCALESGAVGEWWGVDDAGDTGEIIDGAALPGLVETGRADVVITGDRMTLTWLPGEVVYRFERRVPEISVTDARITAVACGECGIMPHDMECLTGQAEAAGMPRWPNAWVGEITADDAAGLPTPESATAAHNAARPWSAKGAKRKGSSVAVKRQRQRVGAAR